MARRDGRWRNVEASVGPDPKWKNVIRFEIVVRDQGQLFTNVFVVEKEDLVDARFNLYGTILDDMIKDIDKKLEAHFDERYRT